MTALDSIKKTGEPETPIILIDGSSYLYRAFHALPPLTNSKNKPTGAIYGVINMIKKLIKTYTPHYIAVIFDTKAKTFRDELYPAYKANRKVMPDELQVQIEPLHDLIKAMGLPLILIDGVEADDIIATLALKFSKKNYTVLISTGDKDMAQLVSPHITLINTMNNYLLNEQTVIEKFGVSPAQIIDYLTLIGDTSDNIPGVAGVGPKTAAKWLNQFHTLDNLIQHRNEIKGKSLQSLEEALAHLPLSRQLITLKSDVADALQIELKDLSLQPFNTEQLSKLFTELEFKTWLSELTGETQTSHHHPKKISTKKIDYQCILNPNDFEQLLLKLKSASLFSVDTETTSLNIIDAKLVGLSFGFSNHQAYYIPLAHDYPGAPTQLSKELVLQSLKPILENATISKIAHHAKYDINIFKNEGIELNGVRYDTMLESYLIQSSGTRHDMDTLALKYLGRKTVHFEDIAGKGVKQLTFNQIDIDTASNYAAEDADVTFHLHEVLYKQLENNSGLLHCFQSIEMPLLFILAEMERTGVLVNASLLHQQSEQLGKQIEALEQQAFQEVGKQFNLSSPKQLQEIFYGQLKLPILEKTPTGQPSTSESVLQELAIQYPLPNIILEHRTLSKLKSTYTDKLPEEINIKTGRIHTSYHQTGTSTGRLSSSRPNLQNIPIRTQAGRNIRKAFTAPKQFKILSADYSQIELRLMAHLSQDDNLLNAFEHGLDVHTATASEIFNVKINEVNSEQRRGAKAVNFGLIYGMSAFGLSKQLGVSREIAQEYIDIYFSRYPNVKKYMSEMKTLAHQQGFVTTIFGRQLHLPEINARNIQRQKAAERAAINAPLQGSAADLIKIAMIHIHDYFSKHHLQEKARMILQVHDELVFEIEESILETCSLQIKTLMENAVSLSVPLIVSIGVGDNWDEAH